MATWFLYSLYISGILLTIDPVEMSFPGGNFCYKFVARDYVASMGFGRRIRKNVYDILPSDDGDEKEEKITKKEKNKLIEEMVYHVYLDNPQLVGGAKTRWLSGVLVTDLEKSKYCDPLFDVNPKIEREALLHQDEPEREKKASDVFEQTIYQHVNLPSVSSLAFKFPYTNGFLSGLVLSYKRYYLVIQYESNPFLHILILFSDHSRNENISRRKRRIRQCSCHYFSM